MSAKTVEPTPFQNIADAFASDEAAPAWLRDARRFGKKRYEEVGFPTTRQENWRFTNATPIAKGHYHAASKIQELSADQLAKLRTVTLDGPTVVFVNGLFNAPLSSIEADGKFQVGVFGETVDAAQTAGAQAVGETSSSEEFGTAYPFAFLNTALLRDGVTLTVRKGVKLSEPIQLVFVQTEDGVMSHARVVVELAEDAEASLVEEYVGSARNTFQNAVVQVRLAPRSLLRHVRLQREHVSAHHVSTVLVNQAEHSRYDSHSIALGAALARTDHTVSLNGEHAACTVDGLYLTDGKRHVDFHTSIEHNQPNCQSRELFKGIVNDESTAVFNGKVVVPPHAQKTDSEQGNHNLLLSRDALIHTKPELEIFADDVKCAHGATVGQLDETALFYMRTRGIGEDEARQLLTLAFARDVVAKIELEPLREAVSQAVERQLTGTVMQ